MDVKELYLVALCYLLHTICTSVHAMSCGEARDRCATISTGCSAALHTYFITCGGLVVAPENANGTCSKPCMESLLSLMTTELGEEFIKCSCEDNEACRQQKSRIQVCSEEVLQTMDKMKDDSPIKCSLAKLVCEADTTCYTALQYATDNCGPMYIGYSCTEKCNRSLSILYNEERGKKLRHCSCQDEEGGEYVGGDRTSLSACQQIKNNEATLCFKEEIEVVPLTTTKSPSVVENRLQITTDNASTRYSTSVIVFVASFLAVFEFSR